MNCAAEWTQSFPRTGGGSDALLDNITRFGVAAELRSFPKRKLFS